MFLINTEIPSTTTTLQFAAAPHRLTGPRTRRHRLAVRLGLVPEHDGKGGCRTVGRSPPRDGLRFHGATDIPTGQPRTQTRRDLHDPGGPYPPSRSLGSGVGSVHDDGQHQRTGSKRKRETYFSVRHSEGRRWCRPCATPSRGGYGGRVSADSSRPRVVGGGLLCDGESLRGWKTPRSRVRGGTSDFSGVRDTPEEVPRGKLDTQTSGVQGGPPLRVGPAHQITNGGSPDLQSHKDLRSGTTVSLDDGLSSPPPEVDPSQGVSVPGGISCGGREIFLDPRVDKDQRRVFGSSSSSTLSKRLCGNRGGRTRYLRHVSSPTP